MPKNGTFFYIPCRVEPGMFRGEWLVFLDAVDPQEPTSTRGVQLLVDERQVKKVQGIPKRNQPAPAWLQVELAERNKGRAKVILPQPAYPRGDALFVDEKLIREELVG